MRRLLPNLASIALPLLLAACALVRGDPAPPERAAESTSEREARLRAHVEALTDEALAGRLTGTEGERRATAYVAEVFDGLGLEPAGDAGGWFERFTFTAGVSAGAGNRLGPAGAAAWELDRDWRPLALSRVGPVADAPVAFAGYGIVAPGAEGQAAYDAYGDLDVRGHWVLVLRYVPDGVAPERRQHLTRYASLRYKAMVARDRGAVGLLVVAGPASQVRNELLPLRADASYAASDLAAVSLRGEIADALLGEERPLSTLQQEIDAAAGGAASTATPPLAFRLPAVRVGGVIDLVQDQRVGRNVLGRLPAAAPDATRVVIGAHVDHLGRGDGGLSLARDDERGAIHVGADDNASGVAVVLELARSLAAAKAAGWQPARELVFAAWSGEELGLLGSAHHVAGAAPHPHAPLSPAIAAYLNYDMVGRLNGENALTLHGVGSSEAWPALLDAAEVDADTLTAAETGARTAGMGAAGSDTLLTAVRVDDAFLPTDATSFYLRGVPVLSFFTGAHAEYHTPRDTPDRLDFAGMTQVVALSERIARDLASTDAPLPYQRQARRSDGPTRGGFRAYLGTIPDYADTGAAGLRLAGVAAGGPADAAGLQIGDRVVELAGRQVDHIYDYTFALGALKIGETVDIVVQRGDERLTLRIKPASRD